MPLKIIIRRYEPDQYIALYLAHPYEGYLIFPAHFIIDIYHINHILDINEDVQNLK